MYICAALYKFVEFNDFAEFREPLYQAMISNDVKGTLLLAREGINGTICGTRTGIDKVLDFYASKLYLPILNTKNRPAIPKLSTVPK